MTNELLNAVKEKWHNQRVGAKLSKMGDTRPASCERLLQKAQQWKRFQFTQWWQYLRPVPT